MKSTLVAPAPSASLVISSGVQRIIDDYVHLTFASYTTDIFLFVYNIIIVFSKIGTFLKISIKLLI